MDMERQTGRILPFAGNLCSVLLVLSGTDAVLAVSVDFDAGSVSPEAVAVGQSILIVLFQLDIDREYTAAGKTDRMILLGAPGEFVAGKAVGHGIAPAEKALLCQNFAVPVDGGKAELLVAPKNCSKDFRGGFGQPLFQYVQN